MWLVDFAALDRALGVAEPAEGHGEGPAAFTSKRDGWLKRQCWDLICAWQIEFEICPDEIYGVNSEGVPRRMERGLLEIRFWKLQVKRG